MFKRLIWIVLAAVLMLIAPASLLAEQTSGSINNETPFVEVPISVAEDGSTIIVDIRPTSGDLDTLLYLVDGNGVVIAENDDRADGDYSSRIEYPLAAAGEYIAIATRYKVVTGSSSGDYDLQTEVIPPAELAPQPNYDVSAEALAAVGFPLVEDREPAEWTVLAYYGGDTNLEPGVLNDMNEFEIGGGSDGTVRVIMLIDRHPLFTDSNGDWTTTRLYELEADVSDDAGINFPPTLDSEPLVDLGNLDTGDGELLAQFLTWGIQSYPAEHYAITFASHGAAWEGLITDDTDAHNILTVPELASAFDAVQAATGVDQFDFLINDACSMSSVEYQAVMANYFDLTLAAAEVVIDPALDMSLFINLLRAGDTDLTAISTTLIDTYMQRDILLRAGQEKEFLTHALTDLTQYDAVTEAINAFATLINEDPARYASLISEARQNTYTYTAFLGLDTLIDTGFFMQQVIALSQDVAIIRAAKDVIVALEDARLYGLAGSQATGRTSHYNIYFPSDSDDFRPNYLLESPLQAWGVMLRNYYNALTPKYWDVDNFLLAYHSPVTPKVRVTRVYPTVASSTTPPTVAMEVTGRNLARGTFTADLIQADGSAVRLFQSDIVTEVEQEGVVAYLNRWRSGVDQSFFDWLPVSLPMVTDGENSHHELLIRTGNMALLEGRYRAPDSEDWFEVGVLFDLNGAVSSIISRDTEAGQNVLASIQIEPGAVFQAYRYVVSPDGIAKPEPGNTYTWGADGLRWADVPAPSGDYNLGFLVEASGGLTGFDSALVSVDNTELDPDWRGYLDPFLGVNIEYPADWRVPADFGDRIQSTSTDGETVINVYYAAARDNVYNIARQAAERHNFVPQEPYDTVQIGGYNGVAFDHTYQSEDGRQWFGTATALYLGMARGGTGVVISVETTASDTTQRNAIYRHVLDTLMIFEPPVATADTTWRYRRLRAGVVYPLPNAWVLLPNESNGDILKTYAPDFESRDRLTIALVEGATDPQSTLANLQATDAETLTDYDRITEREYRAEFHRWQSVTYRYTADDGQSVLGRLYAVRFGNKVYTIRAETPEDESAEATFTQIFELVVDGFAPPRNVITASGDIAAALLKEATSSALAQCADVAKDQVCVGAGKLDIASNTSTDATPLAEVGSTAAVDGVRAVNVGFGAAEVDPYSVGLVKLQANLSDEAGAVEILAFGGVTLLNRVPLQPGQSDRIAVQVTPNLLNVRLEPDAFSARVGSLNGGDQVYAIGRNPAGDWLRVWFPDAPLRSAWIATDFVRPVAEDADLSTLRISDPTLPQFTSMQAFDVLYSEDSDVDAAGVLVKTPLDSGTVVLQINGDIYEIAPGSSFVWKGDRSTLEAVDVTDETTAVIARRRPAGWSTAMLQGAARVQVAQSPDSPAERAPGNPRPFYQARTFVIVTLVAGTKLDVGDGNTPQVRVQIVTFTAEEAAQAQAFATSFGEPVPIFDAEAIAEWQALQNLLNELGLENVEDTGIYFEDDEDFDDFGDEDDDNFFSYIFELGDADLDELLALLSDEELDLFLADLEFEEFLDEFGDGYGGYGDDGYGDDGGTVDGGTTDGGTVDGSGYDGGYGDDGGTTDGGYDSGSGDYGGDYGSSDYGGYDSGYGDYGGYSDGYGY